MKKALVNLFAWMQSLGDEGDEKKVSLLFSSGSQGRT